MDEVYEVHPEIAQSMPQAMEQVEADHQHEEPAQTAAPQVTKQAEESQQQINFRILKERMERAERERDEALKLAQQYQKPSAEPVDDDDILIGPDDIAEGKHLNKVQKELKQLKKELAQYKQQSTMHTAEARLKAQYQDFDKVVSKENIELLSRSYPELAETLRNTPDLYAQGAAAYTMIKKFIDTPSVEAQYAERNIQKPRPTNSIAPQQGDTPLSRANAFANGLTEDLKKQLIAEMNQSRRGY